MFGGNDPFGMFNDIHHQMQRQMNEMEQMMGMGSMPMMMDPFAMMRAQIPMIGAQQHNGGRMGQLMHRQMNPFGAFGFPDVFGQMNGLMNMAVNDPNSVVYSTSTMINMGEGGEPRIVQHSTRKHGDILETRRRVRKDGEEEMEIGHSIGDRAHYLEKKRDKDGNVRSGQRFVNLDEDEAELFDEEFNARAQRNSRNYGFGSRPRSTRSAIEGSRRHTSSSRGPIVEMPDDDEDVGAHSSRARPGGSPRVGGPIIREISDEEAEQSVPKRRR